MKKLSTTPRNVRVKNNKKAGSVMMEYVIVAVMIAAAVVLGVQSFGAAILGQFQASTEAMVGTTETAAATTDNSRDQAAANFETAGEAFDNTTNEEQVER